MRPPHALPLGPVAPESVEHLKMAIGRQQTLGIVLPVQFQQLCGQLPQHAQRARRAVEHHAAGRLARQLAPNDDLHLLDVRHSSLSQPRGGRRTPVDLEQSFDARRRLAGADQRPVAAIARDEPERIDEDRLPRTRFSREQIEAGTEVDGEILDDHQLPNPQGSQQRHSPGPSVLF